MAAPLDPAVFRETIVFLATAGVVIPLVHGLRISPVLGFLAAGLALGPHGLGRLIDSAPWLGWVTFSSSDDFDVFAELGVVFLLFAIGLELSFDRLRTMRRLVLGLGAAQVLLSTLVIGALAAAFGNSLAAALVIGACLALSSTAIVLQLLAEQRRLATQAGRTVFAVLLAQDLAVVPILFLVAMLAEAARAGAIGGQSLAVGFSLAIAQAAAAIAAIVIIGRIALRPLFRLVARTQSRELFVAATLLVALGAALLAHAAGVSMAVGAFLAGLLLAETEFRRQVEVDIEPFKGLLLGMFFISVGLKIDPAEAGRYPLWLAASIVGMVAIKALLIIGLARLFHIGWPVTIETAVLLAGGGEFAFLVLGLAGGGGIIGPDVEQFMLLVASGTMLLTPLFARLGRDAGRRARHRSTPAAESEAGPGEAGHALVIGFGRVGRLIGEMLAGSNHPFLATDRNADLVAEQRGAGRPVVYGDATRAEFLVRCGISAAPAVIVTMDDPLAAERVVAAVRSLRPDVPVVARARDAAHAARLFRLGASDVVPETLEASLDLASAALQTLGGEREAVHSVIRSKREALKAPLRRAPDGTA